MRSLVPAMFVVLLATAPATAEVCATQAENAALATRVLQSELVVAALTCGEKRRYAAFVRRFEPELIRKAAEMKRYFSRNFTGNASRELNALITSLANDASQRSLSEANYCSQASDLFNRVLAVPPSGLEQFALSQPTSSLHGARECHSASRSYQSTNNQR